MTLFNNADESDDRRDVDINKDEGTTTNAEDDDEEEDEDDSGNDDEDFLSEDLNLPETEDDESVPDYPVIMDDSEEDRIFKRQLSYPPIPMYHPPRPQQLAKNNPRDKIGVLTPMEEVTEPPSSAATSIDGERRSRSRNQRCGSRSNTHGHLRLSPPNVAFPIHHSLASSNDQKSILKSKENLQEGFSRRVTFEGGKQNSSSAATRRPPSPAESLASNTSEYSSMADSGRRPNMKNDSAKNEIHDATIIEEAEETEDGGTENHSEEDGSNNNSNALQHSNSKMDKENMQVLKMHPYTPSSAKKSPNIKTGDLGLISDMEDGEKVIYWQMENAKSENGDEENATTSLDSEFASIVNGIIAELHNLDELIGSTAFNSVMEMNASKQDHLANVSTQLATYLAQISPQTIIPNLAQVIPLVTSLLFLTGSNFRSQLASLTAVNVFIERLRDCKAHCGLRVLPNADLTWLVRALCELSSESSRSVLKNEGVFALARLIKTAGPEMVFQPIFFILTGNDEKVRVKRKDDEDRIVIPTGGPGGAPKIKAIALDALTFSLLTFPRDDFNLELVAKLACHCLLHPKRRMRQGSLECLAVISHALGSHIALPMFRQVIMQEAAQMREESAQKSNASTESDASGSAPGSASSDPEAEIDPNAPKPAPSMSSRIPVPTERLNDKPELNCANPLSPQKLQLNASPIAAVQARISRHLLPTPSLNDLVEYAVKIPASSKLLSRQNLAVRRQDESGSGGESGESGGSVNRITGRRTSSSGTSCSSVTNVEIELEPVLNTIGSGRRKQLNELASSVIAADVAWILAGSGPIKACDGTSVLAPIYKLPEKPLISDTNLSHTHLRQLGMLHSGGMESDSNTSESFNQQLAMMRRGSNNPPNGTGPVSLDHNFSNGFSFGSDPNMGRYYYQNANNGAGRGGMGLQGGAPPPDNNNSGRMSSNGSYSLLPNKYSLVGNGMGGVRGGSSNNNLQHGGMDPMMAHHIPGTFDFSNGGGSGYLDGMDGYGGAAPLNPSDLYNDQSIMTSPMRAPSRSKMQPLQPVHNLRQKYFDSSRENMKGNNYSEEEDAGINNPSESSAATSDEEDELPTRKQDPLPKPGDRRQSQVSVKSQKSEKNNKSSRKSGKAQKSSKGSPKKSAKEVKSPENTSTEQNDKVDQIVNRLQQEYQVYRVDRVELDQSGPSPEELTTSKKKRGELDSAGSNSRDSGVSIGAGSVGSVHTPPGAEVQVQQPIRSPIPPEEEPSLLANPTEDLSGASNASNNISNNSTTSNSSNNIKKEERTSKRKSSLKSVKKSGASNTKVVQHAVDLDDGLNRHWKSTPDVASIMDDYDPRLPNYSRMSTEHSIGGGVIGHDIIGTNPYHSSSALGGVGDGYLEKRNGMSRDQDGYMEKRNGMGRDQDGYMMLHRKPVLAGASGRRQSMGRAMDELVEDRQLALAHQQQQQGRSSRMDYHQQHPHHSTHHLNHNNYPNHHSHNGYGGMQGGGGGLSYHHIHHEPESFHRVNSMLEMDKAPSRESSAGSGNTYSLLHHDSALLHHPLSPHLRTSKSTGNLLGVDDPYRQRGNPYFEIMEHPGSPGRRMIHSRLAGHHALGDLGNSTDDMEFPMTPQSESSSNTLPKQGRGMMTGRMNSKIVPKKIYKGSFREVNARKTGGIGGMNAELYPLDLKPVTSPKHALPAALLQVQASDWETNVDGFRQLVRLARHHGEFIRSDLHNVNMNALRHVMNLRSQVCRAAILFFRELFMNVGKAMEHDSERIAEKLLDKAADTNKFIREDSGKALEALVLNVSPAKALTCLDLYGTRHRNPAVRCMTARMTTKLIEKLGADRCLSEVPERLLPMLCRFLQEGSLDTRMSAKLAFSVLMESSSFDTQLKRHVPADTLRHVQKAMKAITTKS